MPQKPPRKRRFPALQPTPTKAAAPERQRFRALSTFAPVEFFALAKRLAVSPEYLAGMLCREIVFEDPDMLDVVNDWFPSVGKGVHNAG